jgi:hypothetical protein
MDERTGTTGGDTDVAMAERADAVALGDEPADTPPNVSEDDGRSAARWLVAVIIALAVLVPLALFTWRAMRAPINFDGGMNLQVARRLAEGKGYTRFYHELHIFPEEVQTNGPWMVLASLGIEVFGPGQFAYQFANLAFIAALCVIVSIMLAREHLAVRLVGPAVVLMAMPLIAPFGLGGLGEVPTTAFLFLCVLCFVQAVRFPDKAPWWVAGASASFGGAFTTKTFSVGASGAVAVGLVCVLLAAPTWRIRRRVVLASGAGVLLVVARELHRLDRLGSIDNYRDWWSNQQTLITGQSGVESSSGKGPIATFLDHMHVLSRLFDLPAELLLVFLLLPLAWVGALVIWRWRRDGLRGALADPHLVMVLIVGVLAASYVLWWLLILPEHRLWIRRILPGMIATHLLYLFMVGWTIRMGRDALWARRVHAASTAGWRRPAVITAVAAVAVAVGAGPFMVDKVPDNTRDLLRGEPQWLEANEDAAAYVEANDDQRYYGDEWWSAPVISLMSGTDFRNLGNTALCSLDQRRDRLVWDRDAKTIRSHDPWTRGGRLVYDEVASFGPYVTIYAVGPAPGKCE